MPAPFVAAGIGVATFVFQLLKYITPTLVKWVLISLGIGFVTYLGMDALVDYAIDQVRVEFNSLPADALALLQYAGVIKAFNIFVGGVTAGLTVKFTLAGAAAGSVKKFKFLA